MMSCLVWDNIPNVNEWAYNYAERRYGFINDNIKNALDILLETVYSDKYYGTNQGAPECGLCCRPLGSLKAACEWGGTKISYSENEFDKAVELFLKDYDKLKDNECYIFDAVDLLRQALSNRITHTVKHLQSAYESKNYLVCCEYGEKLKNLANTMNNVLLNSEYFAFSSYMKIVDEYTAKHDDFTRELYLLDAKALVTTWGSKHLSEDGKLHDYANRQYGDLIKDFYLMRWEKLLENVKVEMDGGTPQPIDWFKLEWDWVLKEPKYTDRLREDSLKAIGKQLFNE